MGRYRSLIHTEQSVQAALYKYFGKKKMKYMLSSAYIYDWKHAKWDKGYRWESDFFFLDKASMAWEVEIKCDKQDADREIKKGTKLKKHMALANAYETGNVTGHFVPNYFFYCAPTGMISLEDIPEYAGLIEVDDDHNLTFMHNTMVHDYVDREGMNDVLLKKFYKKGLRDEQEYIKFVANYKEAKDEEERRQAVILYVRKKRIA